MHASTVARADTCPESVRNQGSPESLAVVVAVAELASTVDKKATKAETALSQGSQERVVVAVAAAVHASTAVRRVTRVVSAQNPKSQETQLPKDLVAGPRTDLLLEKRQPCFTAWLSHLKFGAIDA